MKEELFINMQTLLVAASLYQPLLQVKTGVCGGRGGGVPYSWRTPFQERCHTKLPSPSTGDHSPCGHVPNPVNSPGPHCLRTCPSECNTQEYRAQRVFWTLWYVGLIRGGQFCRTPTFLISSWRTDHILLACFGGLLSDQTAATEITKHACRHYRCLVA